MRVTVRAKLVVGFGDLILMESGYDKSAEDVTTTVTKENEEPAEKRKRTSWWKEDKWPRLKKYLERLRNPMVDGVCDEGCLELGKDPIHRLTVVNCLKIIGSNPITYDNSFPLRYRVLL